MRTYARNVRRAWDGDDYYSYAQSNPHNHYGPKSKRICTENSNPSITFNNAQDENDLEDSLERAIRATSVAISSSPSRKNSTIFSLESQDDATAFTVTPPSSPPQAQLTITPPVVKARKPTFNCLTKKRKRDASTQADNTNSSTRDASEQPLSELVNSSRASAPPPPPPKKPAQQQHLVQMKLDLGQSDIRRSCADCGMEYVPSNEEDAQLHKMYHYMDSSGVELGKTFMKSAMRWAYEMRNVEGCVVIVDRKISQPARRVVQKVLRVVNKELGAAEIAEEALWSQRNLEPERAVEGEGIKQSEAEKRNNNKSDRYKVFLHVKDGKCVGACLAERITTAYRVKPSTAAGEGQSSSIEVEDGSVAAVVGVSRIWTSKAFRRKGIAQNLLDCVLGNFVFGMDVDKDELAFSQPTESGGCLARKWFGEEAGWLVYREE